jgi:hypothetical protein
MFVSCETDHTYKRELVNNTSYPLMVRYNYHHMIDGDSSFVVAQQDTLVLAEWWKFGAHTYADSCRISDEDTIWVNVDSSFPIVFSGDFRDEANWEVEFMEGRSSKQVCRVVVNDSDFVVK